MLYILVPVGLFITIMWGMMAYLVIDYIYSFRTIAQIIIVIFLVIVAVALIKLWQILIRALIDKDYKL